MGFKVGDKVTDNLYGDYIVVAIDRAPDPSLAPPFDGSRYTLRRTRSIGDGKYYGVMSHNMPGYLFVPLVAP